MNNRDKRSLQGLALVICALVAFLWAPLAQADEPSPGLQCALDTVVFPEGSSWGRPDFHFWLPESQRN